MSRRPIPLRPAALLAVALVAVSLVALTLAGTPRAMSAQPTGTAAAGATPTATVRPAATPTAAPTTAAATAAPTAAGTPAAAGPSATLLALTTTNKLVRISSSAPSSVISSVTITGLGENEQLLGIDYRPANGQLIGMSSDSRLYLINATTGAATRIGDGQLDPRLSGTAYGFDFNPLPDRIRLVSNTGQDLRLNPDNGTVAGVDGTLFYANGDRNFFSRPRIVGAGYTNSVAGALSTTLYVIDAGLGILAIQGSIGGGPVSPNSGQLATIGALGVTITDNVGFDIDPAGPAYAAFQSPNDNDSELFSINLTTGAATRIGTIGGGEVVRGLAVVPPVR